MQISRHWRMNPQRYRLEGVRYAHGEMSLEGRPAVELQVDAGVEVQTSEANEGPGKSAVNAA